MDATALLNELTASIVGRPVTFTRLAANSLLLYIDCEPGDDDGYILWFEPTWHMSSSQGVLLGSRQAQGNDPEGGASAAELDGIAEPLLALRGGTVTSLEVDARTHDLTLVVEDDLVVRTFVADPRDDETWHVRDVAGHRLLRGSPSGLAAAHA